MIGRISIVLVCVLLFVYIPSVGFSAEPGKMTVAVMEFRNTSGYQGDWHLGHGMSDMLATALFKTGKFNILERERLEHIMQEKQLAREGEVDSHELSALGQLIGADYIITGTVTEFGISEGGIGGGGGSIGSRPGPARIPGRPGPAPRGGSSGGFGGLGIRTQTARVVVDVRIVDAKTGLLVAADQAEGKESTGSLAVGGGDIRSFGGITFGSTGFDSTLPGKATRKAIESMVEKISGVIFTPKVIDVYGKEVTINVGSTSGIKKDMQMNVISAGHEIIDPDTGQVLGQRKSKVGLIRITEVQPQYSIGIILEGEGYIEIGNLVEKHLKK